MKGLVPGTFYPTSAYDVYMQCRRNRIKVMHSLVLLWYISSFVTI